MNDHLISRSRFLDALVLDADNKTDLIQVHQALEKAVISPDDVRGVGHWVGIDDFPHESWECDRCGCVVENTDDPWNYFHYCPNCGARMKGAEDGTTD